MQAIAEAPKRRFKVSLGVALWILLGVNTLNILDRQIVYILAEPIKRELQLADWQLGLLTGPAFALFYALMSMPIARLAERLNRPRLIGAAIALWSGFTVLTAAATNFLQMLLCRIAVGIGEAGCAPPSHSLIVDSTTQERRARALAIFNLGAPLGALLGLAMGGVIADAYGWRIAFIVAGVPGLLFAVLALLIREPREEARAAGVVSDPGPKLGPAMSQILKKRTFVLVTLGAASCALVATGQQVFTAGYFMRVHTAELAALAESVGLRSTGALGIAMGGLYGVFGLAGTWLAGQVADHARKTDPRAYCTVAALAWLLILPCQLSVFLAPNIGVAFVGYAAGNLVLAMGLVPIHATIQSVAPPKIRTTASATFFIVVSVLGAGMGPLIIGGFSDLLAVQHGAAEGLRWALVLTSAFYLAAFALIWRARAHVASDMEA